MADKILAPDGGPAFPVLDHSRVYGESRDGERTVDHLYADGGLSMRDYFAAYSMAAMARWHSPVQGSYADLARDAYAMADAMLAARQR